MQSLRIFLLLLMSSMQCMSQKGEFVEIDSLYREDQVYASVTYNLLANKPNGVSQNGFSSGFHIGVIRDMPINKKRNVAIGIGLGYSGNSYNQNLLIAKDETKSVTYSVLTDDFTKNKFSTHLLEVPLEFRWRSSSVSDYKFWRIYAGFKMGYLFTHATKYRGSPSNQIYTDIDHFNDLQYALTLSFGYNTWNFHLHYGLNPIFNDKAILENKAIDMRAVKIGLMFYLL